MKKPLQHLTADWQQTHLFHADNQYWTHPALQFSDYDDSGVDERANVLFLVREATSQWSGEIEYDPLSDKVRPHEPPHITVKLKDWWNASGVLLTSVDPMEDRAEAEQEWPLADPPCIILQSNLQQTTLWLSKDFWGEQQLADTLKPNECIATDTYEEVEILLRDSAWENVLRPEIERWLIVLWNTREYHQALCQRVVDHTPGQAWEGKVIVKPQALKDAFWQHLKDRNDYGYFENTKWQGFYPEEVAKAVTDILNKTLPRAGTH